MSFDLSGDPALLRSYLLGQLGEDDADALEIRLLQDDVLFELAEAVEGDLLAAFSRGELAPNERKQVIRRLAASPRGRARLALAEGLTSLAGRPAQAFKPPLPFRRQAPLAERPAFRFAAVAAGVLVMAGGVWLALQIPHPDGTVIAARAARNEATSAVRSAATPQPARHQALPPAPPAQKPVPEIARKRQAEPPSHRPLPAFVFQLAVSVTRSPAERHPVITIPTGTQRLEIQLPLDEGLGESFTAYSAAVLDAASGSQVWSQDHLAPRAGQDGPMVVLALPAAKLPEGMYTVELHGLGENGDLELVGNRSFEVRLISAQR